MGMKLILFTFFVVVVLSEVYGLEEDVENAPSQSGWRRPGGWGRPGGRGRPGGWRRPGGWGRIGGKTTPPFRQRDPPPMFPKCKEFMNAVYEKLRETRKPFACRNAADKDECMYQALLKARMAVTVKPSKECLDQMQQFMEGVPTTTTTEAEVTTTTEAELTTTTEAKITTTTEAELTTTTEAEITTTTEAELTTTTEVTTTTEEEKPQPDGF
ncbi:uncharacterized protein TNCT_101271 [Trichonephila clavata]|uniref:Uncharacterized protein n=1 Tax=Trichonephila clavata TaxID=2740835 RepID=A0A8X6IB99_TRICU|nr:uncharacterized protein TNCT_101271 [Trichonephila clavata]